MALRQFLTTLKGSLLHELDQIRQCSRVLSPAHPKTTFNTSRVKPKHLAYITIVVIEKLNLYCLIRAVWLAWWMGLLSLFSFPVNYKHLHIHDLFSSETCRALTETFKHCWNKNYSLNQNICSRTVQVNVRPYPKWRFFFGHGYVWITVSSYTLALPLQPKTLYSDTA